MQDTYILGGARTPSGSFLGPLSTVPASQLGATAIQGALKSAGISPTQVGEVYMGHVVQAGTGQAPARQAAIFAGLPHSGPCTTINKVCGSGLMAVILASRAIQAGDADIAVAGGMENMSLAPHLIPMRVGQKYGEVKMRDALQWDGLWDVYSDRPMGNCAEEAAKKYQLSRQEQDDYAIESFKRSQKAQQEGVFASEIVPVVIKGKKGDVTVSEDDGPMKADFAKIPKLPPVFDKAGTISAANASSINDGAAALVLAGPQHKANARFRIVATANHAQDPTWFTTAPVEAMRKCAQKGKVDLKNIDLFEINEAFALVPMLAIKELSIPHSKVNIYGGGVGLGHPIGASGARILVTLMTALDKKNGKLGMASICIGGGEALAILIEKIK